MVSFSRAHHHAFLVLAACSLTALAAAPKLPIPLPIPVKTPTKVTTTTTTSKPATTSAAVTTTSTKPVTSTTSSSTTLVTTTSAVTTPTTTTTTTFALPIQTPSTTSVPAGFIRGVNAGGWLILEPWMTPYIFNGTTAVDQLSFDALAIANATLQNHWATYFTEWDVQGIAGYGMNAIRIPIGFWAFDPLGSNYLTGAQVWLDQAIGWARKYGVRVLVDIHGSHGSQNGWDHSGNSTGTSWQLGSNSSMLGPNMLNDIDVLKQVGLKYGSAAFADVVYAIEIANEPISWGNQDINITKNWAAVAYNAIKSVATNPSLQVIVHDGFVGPQGWYDLASAINNNTSTPQFAIDTHLYQNMVAADSALNMTQHIQKACDWGNVAKNSAMPVYVGEFSAAVNVCVNPDGTSFGNDGTKKCTVAGCQCTDTVPITSWSPALKNLTRMYWEAQLQAFEHANSGYFLWSMHGYGAWSLVDLYNYGIVGGNINERVYGNQCTFTV